MSTYVMSDIHGDYKSYRAMLEKIDFSNEDELYILGDILDRGPNPIKIMLDLMKRPNVEIIAGNHCSMALGCLKFLMKEITEESISEIDDRMIDKLLNWDYNGSETTINEFYELDKNTQMEVVDFISEFELFDEVEVNGKTFIMVHAGLGNFSPDRQLWDYELDELIWERPDYSKAYFDDKYVITGHTPTMLIEDNPRPGFIYQANNHIAIDCGCIFSGGRLGCLRLDDMEEFYVEGNN